MQTQPSLFDLEQIETAQPEQPASVPHMDLEEANKIFNATCQLAIGIGQEYQSDNGLIYVLDTQVFKIEYFGHQDKVLITLHTGEILFDATGTADGVGSYRWRQAGFAWRKTLGAEVKTIKRSFSNQ
jgi:hypothetical protein